MTGQDKGSYKQHRFWDVLCFIFYKLKLSLSLSFFFLSYHQGCSYPPLIAHGRYTQKSSYIGWNQHKEATYQCDEGYTLVGEATLSCSNSRWSAPAPRCKGNSSPWLGAVSYTHLTLPTSLAECRSRWSPYH